MKSDGGVEVRTTNVEVEKGILSLGGVSIEIASIRRWENRLRGRRKLKADEDEREKSCNRETSRMVHRISETWSCGFEVHVSIVNPRGLVRRRWSCRCRSQTPRSSSRDLWNCRPKGRDESGSGCFLEQYHRR